MVDHNLLKNLLIRGDFLKGKRLCFEGSVMKLEAYNGGAASSAHREREGLEWRVYARFCAI